MHAKSFWSAFSVLTSRAWWAAAGQRAARSALVILVPYVMTGGGMSHVNLAVAGSAAALMAVLSLATSLAGLPELDGTGTSWWAAALVRGVKSFAQGIVALAGPSWVLLSDVPWGVVLDGSAAAAIGSVILGLIGKLPEAQPVTVPAASVVQVVSPDGAVVAGPASPPPDGNPIVDPTPAS
ncbi:MAG: hypothetical protein ACYCTH_13450 [Cellulomonas sp.]